MLNKKDKSIFYEKQVKTINFETGKVIEEKMMTNSRVSAEPQYVKLYINTLLAFKDLPKTLNPVLLEMLKYMTFADEDDEQGGQLIIMSKFIKERIIKKLDIKMNTLDKALGKLSERGILKRVGQGAYQVNPHMFGKGEWKDIKSIRANFNFNTGELKAKILKE